MEVSRRQLFRLGQVCLVAAAAPVKVFGLSFDAGDDPFLALSSDTFAMYLGTRFVTSGPSGNPASLVLSAVQRIPAANPDQSTPRVETFALKFYGVGELLPQDTYTFEHESLRRLSLFVVPSGTGTYTAIINRLKDPLPPGYSIPAGRTLRGAPAAAGNHPAIPR